VAVAVDFLQPTVLGLVDLADLADQQVAAGAVLDLLAL
jgi:hypothetical protein